MARTSTRKTTTARRARKTTAASARRTTSRSTGGSTAARASVPPVSTSAASSGISDLAGGLKTFLTEIESEVRAVTALSERIDRLVTELNGVREEQSQRLLALDALRASAEDGGLTSFLDKLIRPRQPRVPEVIPDRLTK
jgi:hypothetical protein